MKSGELKLHVSIPLELYQKYLSRVSQFHNPRGHIAGFDFNPDRINMVIANRKGELLDVKTEHFPEVTSHGYPKEKARDIRRKALVKLVNYAHHHGVTDYVIEKLRRPRAKTLSKTANRKISKLPIREYLEHMKVLAPRYGGKLHPITSIYLCGRCTSK